MRGQNYPLRKMVSSLEWMTRGEHEMCTRPYKKFHLPMIILPIQVYIYTPNYTQISSY